MQALVASPAAVAIILAYLFVLAVALAIVRGQG